MKKMICALLLWLATPQGASAGWLQDCWNFFVYDFGVPVYTVKPNFNNITWYDPIVNTEKFSRTYTEQSPPEKSLRRKPFITIKKDMTEFKGEEYDNSLRRYINVEWWCNAQQYHLMIPDLLAVAGIIGLGTWWWYKRKYVSGG